MILTLGAGSVSQAGAMLLEGLADELGEFLKGYKRKKLGRRGGGAGYSQDGDSRGLAQVCEIAMGFRSAGQRC